MREGKEKKVRNEKRTHNQELVKRKWRKSN